MRKYRHLAHLLMLTLTLTLGLASCSEEDNTENEYADWVSRNDQYFLSVYNTAKANADGTWKIIGKYSYSDSVAALSPTNNIVVRVIEEGSGTTSPIYTDSVKVNYRGRYMATTQHPSGYVFDQSYQGEYVPELVTPSSLTVSGVVDGFSTALQHMHAGDRWMVYIPYQLGYGESDYTASSSSATIPGGSTLIFDLVMVSYSHPGDGTAITRSLTQTPQN